MLKKLFKFFLAILVLITVAITYLSFFGIKTNKFNNIINEKIKIINPELNLLLNDVYLKINIPQTSININTSNSKININNSSINVSKIEIDLDIVPYPDNYKISGVLVLHVDDSMKGGDHIFNQIWTQLASYFLIGDEWHEDPNLSTQTFTFLGRDIHVSRRSSNRFIKISQYSFLP